MSMAMETFTRTWTEFGFLGHRYRTTPTASTVEVLQRTHSGEKWNETSSLRVIAEARRLMVAKAEGGES
jgi:hypothetical protein